MATNDQQRIERQAQKLWQQANESLNAGRPAKARPHLEKLVGLIPGDPVLRYNLGACLYELGNKAASIQQFEKATGLADDFTEAHFMLGMALTDSGKEDQAAAAFTKVLSLDADHSGASHALGHAHFVAGRYNEALPHLRRAAMSQTAKPVYELGLCLFELGRDEEALAALRAAVELDPEEPTYALEFGRRMAAISEFDGALAAARAALAAAPEDAQVLQQFARIVGVCRFETYDEALLSDVERALVAGTAVSPDLARAALDLLALAPGIDKLLQQESAANELDHNQFLDDPAVQSLICRDVLRLIMRRALVCDSRFEWFLKTVRAALVQAWQSGRDFGEAEAAFIPDLALQAHATEFLYPESERETLAIQAMLAELAAIIDAGSERTSKIELLVSLVGSYQALDHLPFAARLASLLEGKGQGIFDELLARCLTNPLRETGIREDIRRLTPITHAVSAKVRDQYDENPYPRWFMAPTVIPQSPADQISALFPHMEVSDALLGSPNILIAGCGSGWHTAVTGQLYPDCRILAVDLSQSNLAYAIRQLGDAEIRNVECVIGDIMELGILEEQFPLVESIGVLHHLSDPEAGWRVLADLTAPGGVMHIALYSEISRRELVGAKAMIDAGDFAPTRDGIAAFRQAVFALPADDPVRRDLVSSPDFYSVSACRDLLFHVQEHLFTVPRLKAALDGLGLEFLGFQLARPQFAAAYREMFPDDPHMADLDHWEVYENRHPETFRSMYDFYCRKPDG